MPLRCPTSLVLAPCLLFLLLVFLPVADAAPRCAAHDQPPPTNCKYGTHLDWCRNGVCAKGPSERCGGYQWEHGRCGEGTYCHCDQCRGCSPFDNKCHDPTFMC